MKKPMLVCIIMFSSLCAMGQTNLYSRFMGSWKLDVSATIAQLVTSNAVDAADLSNPTIKRIIMAGDTSFTVTTNDFASATHVSSRGSGANITVIMTRVLGGITNEVWLDLIDKDRMRTRTPTSRGRLHNFIWARRGSPAASHSDRMKFIMDVYKNESKKYMEGKLEEHEN